MKPALVVAGRSLTSQPVPAVGVGFSVVAVAMTAARGLDHRAAVVAVSFGLLIFVGELARVALPGDREIAPVAVAGALGYALTFDQGGVHVHPHPLTVAAVTAVAGAAGAVVHGVAGRPTGISALSQRVIAVAVAAALFHAYCGDQPRSAKDVGVVAVMMLVVVAGGAVAIGLAAVDRAVRHGTPLLAGVRDEVRAVAGIGAAIGATGVLIALAGSLMRLWALPTLSLPLLVAQFSMRRYSGIRATYRQTIRALAKVTEVGGYVTPGHSGRVAALAVAAGRELGMSESDLLDLEYAALMHDIGQLSLADPIPGGSTLMVPPLERRRIAELGGEVIRSAGALARVALIVERQADPYRRNRRPPDPTLPLASRIIKAASAYDDIVSASASAQASAPDSDSVDDRTSRADALERLRLGMAYEYDPRVVEALASVVARLPVGVVPSLPA